MGVLYDKITTDLEIYLQTMMSQNVVNASLSNCQMNMNISSLIDSLSVHRRTRDIPTAAAVIQKVKTLRVHRSRTRLLMSSSTLQPRIFVDVRPHFRSKLLRQSRQYNHVFQAVEGLLDCMNQDDPDISIRYRDSYLRILKVFQDSRSMGVQWTNKQVTK